MKVSSLQKARYEYSPKLPPILRDNKLSDIAAFTGRATQSVSDQEQIQKLFPNTYGMPQVRFEKGDSYATAQHQTVGVILSGGQAPGGHNVITGLYDALKKANKENVLIGFKNGPAGLLENSYITFEDSYIDQYRNTGGFDIIGSGRTKLEDEEQFKVAAEVCKKLNINALVIIGGDDSNTNAAVLAEYFAREKTGIQVIGCPKTIDGDLKNDVIEISFGFDTATKTYSELIGNICRDANSAKKYWHFIKVMGRSASHIALECALETQPNICLIGEEVEAKKQSLTDVVNYIADTVAVRAEDGNNFGVIIIPEGLIEFIPEVKKLIAELNDLLAHHEAHYATLCEWQAQFDFVCDKLCKESCSVFQKLPVDIQMQLLMDRDPHGNVQVSRIETDKLLITLTERELKERKEKGTFKGKFSALNHFFGYEGRCAFPSNFDADYCYSLGFTAYLLISNGYTGYIASITNTAEGTDKWDAGGMPITAMMNLEQRHGKQKPVIRKALTELDGAPFKYFASKRDVWARETSFLIPGAIQYYGPSEVCDLVTKTLELEQAK